MFFPIRTDRRLQRTPWVNYSLIGTNLVVFLLTDQGRSQNLVGRLMLFSPQPSWWQFISYQFLHAGWMHLLGNMLFLYVFGNSVEDRLGKFSYLMFYLAGGVIAGLGHALVESAPVLGASGAVAGVSGAYLALFPLSNVTIVYLFIFIGTFEISSMMLILFQIGQDAFMFIGRFGGVAYLAHLSGYAYGFTIGIGLLWMRLLNREPYDLLTLISHRRRRSQFKTMARQGYRPWDHQHAESGNVPADDSPEKIRIMEMRSRISSLIAAHDVAGAAGLYVQLLGLDPNQIMAQQLQLDLANQLMVQERYDDASRAYELFLQTFTKYQHREQIELIMGLIYGRYLDRHERAWELLSAALPKLHEQDQIDLAQAVLAEIEQ